MKQLIDLSHAVEDGMVTYKGIPAPIICDYLTREASKAYYTEGTTFHIGKIEMVANTGTYIDSPFHRYADGKDLSELSLSSIAFVELVKTLVIVRRHRVPIRYEPPQLSLNHVRFECMSFVESNCKAN